VTGELVALPDQITEVGLLHRLVVETEFRRPDLAEQHAADRRINDFLVGIAETVFLPRSGFAKRMRSCVFTPSSL
jgi:hypothetical protein